MYWNLLKDFSEFFFYPLHLVSWAREVSLASWMPQCGGRVVAELLLSWEHWQEGLPMLNRKLNFLGQHHAGLLDDMAVRVTLCLAWMTPAASNEAQCPNPADHSSPSRPLPDGKIMEVGSEARWHVNRQPGKVKLLVTMGWQSKLPGPGTYMGYLTCINDHQLFKDLALGKI